MVLYEKNYNCAQQENRVSKDVSDSQNVKKRSAVKLQKLRFLGNQFIFGCRDGLKSINSNDKGSTENEANLPCSAYKFPVISAFR